MVEKIKIEPFDLKKVVFASINSVREILESKGLFLSVRVPNDVELTIEGSEEPITHVINNFLTNAITFTKSGGIIVSLSRKDGNVLFFVKDTGIGITPENAARLFPDPSKTDKSKMTSIGLGLYLAKRTVDAHGGRIWVESDGPGRGSTFFVELPIHATQGNHYSKKLGKTNTNNKNNGKVFGFITSVIAYAIVGVISLVVLAVVIPLLIGAGYLLVWSIPLLVGIVLILVIIRLLA